jgi:hypothetical protein
LGEKSPETLIRKSEGIRPLWQSQVGGRMPVKIDFAETEHSISTVQFGV